jgi:hypothetical protein
VNDLQWATFSWTVVTALGAGLVAVATGIWAVFTWMAQRAADRAAERQRIAALYVHPFLFAAEELQSRLFNILERRGLVPLTDSASPHPFAEETAYLVAQYFAWERALLRHGPHTGDREVIRLTGAIRKAFASDTGPLGARMRLFHPEQRAIAQAMTRRIEGQLGIELEVVPFHAFRRAITSPAAPAGAVTTSVHPQARLAAAAPPEGGGVGGDPLLAELADVDGLRRLVQTLQSVTDLDRPPGAARMAVLQGHLVDLLRYLERKERLALFDGERLKAGARDGEDRRVSGSGNPQPAPA